MKNSVLNKDFKRILYHSKSLPVRDLLFYYAKHPHTSISFIVSRQKGNAVLRNQFKRRCRALLNQYSQKKLKGYCVIIKPNQKIKDNYSWNELSLSFEEFCSKLSI